MTQDQFNLAPNSASHPTARQSPLSFNYGLMAFVCVACQVVAQWWVSSSIRSPYTMPDFWFQGFGALLLPVLTYFPASAGLIFGTIGWFTRKRRNRSRVEALICVVLAILCLLWIALMFTLRILIVGYAVRH